MGALERRSGRVDLEGAGQLKQQKNKERQQRAMRFWKDLEPHFDAVDEHTAISELMDV